MESCIYLRLGVVLSPSGTCLVAFSAQAQDAAPANIAASFAGFRLEGNIGWDKIQSLGRNNEKLGCGGSVGFEGNSPIGS